MRAIRSVRWTVSLLTLLGVVSAAAATERKPQRPANDYYAYAGGVPAEARHAATGEDRAAGCYVTLTPAEATRGMRHYRPGC